ncbi:putative ribonuclease H-like domain-containing protein [Tanacetum coccineum]|uniref:Ribonuclease H-like domain-containing protein n=1 Tax=Tanacetum coccineum TaxID=301880 RepID=A0ABQ5BVP6_9ASTR
MPPTPGLSFTGLDEFVNKPVVENCKAMSSEEEPKVVKKNGDAPIIEEWVSDDVEEDVSQPKTKKKIVRPSIVKKEFVKSKQQEKIARKTVKQGNPQMDLQDQRVIDSRCSRHMTGNMSYLTNYEEIDGGYVSFGGNPKGGKITRKCTIKTGNLDFENVYFVRELKFNLFSVSQMCDKKNSVLFNDTECIVLAPNFKLIDEIQVLLRVLERTICIVLSGCSRHMTGNMSYLTDFEEIDGGYVAFGGNPKGGKITGRGTIKTGNLDFENVYFVRELKFNLFSVSQMCDKKNSVLFNDTECIVLSPNFKLTDESHVLLKVPRKNNMYSVDLKNIVPKGGLTCLFAKATSDESKLWHRRLGHINFKTMNKLVKGNLVRGLPSKLIENNQICVACQKGKQHRASSKSKTVSSISQPLHMLHMDLFGPTFVKSLMKKMYCLVVTDDYSRFSWVFFLATKDETSSILKSFITGVENLKNQRVKVIRTPQQNGVAERKNRTLIEAARTMLADSKLPTTFWAEVVNTACYVQNRVQKHVMMQSPQDDGSKPSSDDKKKVDEDPRKDSESIDQERHDNVNNTNNVNAANTNEVNAVGGKTNIELTDDPNMPALEDYRIFDLLSDDQDNGAEADMNNLDTTIQHLKQEEWIDYDDVFALVAKIEEIRLFLAYASFKDFVVYQMDVKSAFLYGKIEEEVYVDDIIFGSTKKELCNAFEKLMHEKFQMSSMGELTFFLGLQVKQKNDGIFISQDKYVAEILKKFGFTEVKTASTPMETQKPLLKDEDGEEVDVHLYRSMIGSLMYLTSSRPDIMFAVCACARYQVNPKVSHLYAVKRIFRYLKGQPKLGLWYPKDSPFDLVAYTDSDYAGASLDRKSTTGGCQFLGCRLISWQCKKQTVVANSTTKAEYVAASSCCGQTTAKVKTINGESQLHARVDGKKIIIIESTMRRDLQLEDAEGVDCLPNATIFEQLTLMGPTTTAWNEFSSTMASAIICLATNQKFNFSKLIFESMMKNLDNLDDSLVRDATTAFSLEVEHDSGNIIKSRSKATPNEADSQGTTSGGGPRRQDTMRDTIAQTRFENVSKTSNDSLLTGVNTPRSDEDSIKLKELMEFCTKLKQRVLDLENTKTTQAQEITSLKLRVKKLEKKGELRTHKLKRLYKVSRSARVISSNEASLGDQEDASKQGRKIDDIDKDAEITLVDETQARYGDDLMFDTCVLDDEEVFAGQDMAKKEINVAKKKVSTADPTLIEIRSAKPKVKGVVIGEQSESTTRTRPQQLPSKDKGKGKMVELEKPMKKKELIRLDEEIASNLQAEFDEEVILAKEKAEKEQEANVALTEEWDDIQATIKADHELAQRLQAQEQEKNMFDKAFKKMNTFVDFRTDLVEGSSKRAGEELEHENVKKQKVDDDKETAELKSLMEVMPDEEEVALAAIPLAVKSPSIVDCKIHKEGKKSYYQIIRADGSSKIYLVFNHMLKVLTEKAWKLWRIVGIKRLLDDLGVIAAQVGGAEGFGGGEFGVEGCESGGGRSGVMRPFDTDIFLDLLRMFENKRKHDLINDVILIIDKDADTYL